MSSRRSGRSKSKIDYSKFGGDDDFDDDFADLTPPPNKKAKTASENKENNLRKKIAATVHEKKKKERPSVDEKIFDRDLQAALELSLNESQNSAPEKTDEEPSNTCVPETSSAPLQAVKVSNGPNDEIVVLDEDEEKPTATNKQRAASVKKPKYNEIDDKDDEGSDFDAFSEESDDGDDDYEDSDFEGFKDKNKKGKGKTKGKTKNETKSKQKSPVKPKQKSPAVAKQKTPVSVKHKTNTAASGKISQTVKSPSYSSPAGSSDNRKWNPPGLNSSTSVKSSLGGVSITSPSSGLRLGLSRNQKLKPLHPTLKIQH